MAIINIPARATIHSLFSLRPVRQGTNALLVLLWLWFYRPLFDYLAIIFSAEDFRTNQLLLVAVIALIATQVHKEGLRPKFDALPQRSPAALAFLLGGAILFLLVERFLDINTLSATLCGLSGYGLLGLWMSPQRWRQGLPAALLIIGTLPFGQHMQTFIGYPMRILTAAIVGDGLSAAGVASIGIDTILVFENGVSQVDLPCSGVKSLWTGMLFLVAATWIERRPLTRRWFLVALLFTVLLFIANLARVGVLVVVGQVMGWQLAAEMLHVPLGVLGFVVACAAALGLLRWQRPISPTTHTPALYGRPLWLAPALALALVVLGLLYAPRPQTGLAQTPPQWQFPAELLTEPMPLKPDEFAWLTRDGAESADRRRFQWRGISGSMILITSTTWRAHHRPERCFEVYGLSLNDSRTHLVNATLPVRFVALGNDDDGTVLSATYWFQSADHTTDDYATRIWADLAPERQRWVLVSILFDEVQDPNTAELQAFYTALHNAIGDNLSGQESVSMPTSLKGDNS